MLVPSAIRQQTLQNAQNGAERGLRDARELPEFPLVQYAPLVQPDPQVLPAVPVSAKIAKPDVVPVVGQGQG